MTNRELLKPLAHFAYSLKFEDIPDDVKEVARQALCDFTAVTAAGAGMPAAQSVLRYVRSKSSSGPCTLFGQSSGADAELAALFTGTASHVLDFDDVSWTTIGHPTVAVAPAALALTQETGGTGADLIRAYVVGVEVMHRIARWTMPALSEQGWHTTPAYGVFGAAAAACALTHATETETVNALGIAASRAGGLRANFGTQTKALHAGLCAMAGIESARLAMCGITANPSVIEALDGFAQCLAGVSVPQEAEVELGRHWDLREAGLVFKQYPCCSGSHPTNDVWNDFVREHHLVWDEIDHIEAGVSLLGPRELNCHYPQDCVAAKFSLEFAIACRVVFGPIGMDSFVDEKVLDTRVQSLMKRIEMKVDPQLAKLGFIGTAPVRLTVYLKNGSVHRLANDLACGNPQKPLTKEQQKTKFFECLRHSANVNCAQEWWDLLQNLQAAGACEIARLGEVQ